MNRYQYTDAILLQRVFPSQKWIKKSYPDESIVILHYLGNNSYECQVIDHNSIGSSIPFTIPQITTHYKLIKMVDIF